MSAALPLAPLVTGDARALTLYDACPSDCGLIAITDGAFAPHLRPGESAVIDADDREPVPGEIYVVKISSPADPAGYRLRIVQLRCREYDFVVEGVSGDEADPALGWMMHFSLIRPLPCRLTGAEIAIELAAGRRRLCDGPLRTDGMRRYIVGRVVGVVPVTFA